MNKYDKILGEYREDDGSVISPSAVYLTLDQSTAQTLSASPILNWLSASQALMTDANKKLISVDYLDQAVKTTSDVQFDQLGLGQAPSTSKFVIKQSFQTYLGGITLIKSNTTNPFYIYVNGTNDLAFTELTTGTERLTIEDGAAGTIKGNSFTSTIAIGTSPFPCTSTTLNTNLNADLWDGYQFADYLDQAVKTTSTPQFARLGVGGASVSSAVISEIDSNYDLNIASKTGVNSFNTYLSTQNTANSGIGIGGYATATGTVNYTGSIRGLSFYAASSTTGTAPTLYGMYLGAGGTGTENVTLGTVYGSFIFPLGITGGNTATINTYYGLYLSPSIGTSSITNNYGIYQADTLSSNVFAGLLRPASDNAVDLGAVGATDYRFRHLYLSGNLSDETNTLTIANAKTAYDHSQDNTQAHSDYLLNNADDTTSGSLTLDTNGKILTIPYGASTNITYGSGAGMTMQTGVANAIAIALADPNTGSPEVMYAFVSAPGGTNGMRFNYTDSSIDITRAGTAVEKFYVSNGATNGLGIYSNYDIQGRCLLASGDNSAGLASNVTFTNVTTETLSTGACTILSTGATPRVSTGWIKIWSGTNARYIPYWTTISG